MKQVHIKVGRNFLWVDERDVLMDNGAIIQFISQKRRSGYGYSYIRMGKQMFNNLIKTEFLYTNNDINNKYNKNYEVKCVFYQFNVEKMIDSGYLWRDIENGIVLGYVSDE